MKTSTLLWLSCCLLGVLQLSGQSIVGTSPTNKNIILEEMTGIYCGYCPDGHLKAQQLADANSGRVVIVNIHAGSYASPSASDPDFRTSWGNYVNGLFSISGYPTGAVNRRSFFGSVMNNRSSWAGHAFTVMSETSPVNVGATANLDLGGRIASVNVEAYYTANGTGTVNNMHVILMQDNVPGPQSGGSTWNPNQVLPNGDYNHMHMFRHNLSPNAGDAITNTSSGSLYSNSYSYAMPNDYLGVALNIPDVHVAVFVSEGSSTGAIETGDYASLTFVTPTNALDMATSSGHFGSLTDYCANGSSFNPAFEAVNATPNTINSIEASYTINNGSPVTTTLTGLNLSNGQGTTINFPAVALAAGVNQLEYNIVQINGSDPDYIPSNNLELNGKVVSLTANPVTDSLVEDFESPDLTAGSDTLGYSQLLSGALFINPYSVSYDIFGVVGYAGSTYDLGQCIQANFGSTEFPTLSYGEVIFDNVNLTNRENINLSFDYAHAEQTQNFGDGYLEVFASTDCGATWDTLWRRIGPSLATANAVWAPNYFYPMTADWQAASVDLTAYENNARLAIKMKMGKIASANSLYIDNINISSTLNQQNLPNIEYLNIFPNPAKEILQVAFNNKVPQQLKVQILNTLGQQVVEKPAQFYHGSQMLSFDIKALKAGVYFLSISNNSGVETRPFVVQP